MRACETALREKRNKNGAGDGTMLPTKNGAGGNNTLPTENGAGDGTMLPTKKPKKGAGGTEPHTADKTKKCKQNERDVTAGRYRLYDMTPPGDTGLMQ